jgi:hypothetical protein
MVTVLVAAQAWAMFLNVPPEVSRPILRRSINHYVTTLARGVHNIMISRVNLGIVLPDS